MGQKVNPLGLRLGINRTWDSRWYADANYSTFLENDLKIRKYIERESRRKKKKKNFKKKKFKNFF